MDRFYVAFLSSPFQGHAYPVMRMQTVRYSTVMASEWCRKISIIHLHTQPLRRLVFAIIIDSQHLCMGAIHKMLKIYLLERSLQITELILRLYIPGFNEFIKQRQANTFRNNQRSVSKVTFISQLAFGSTSLDICEWNQQVTCGFP